LAEAAGEKFPSTRVIYRSMRNKRLDILRAIAVLLVMFNHDRKIWPMVSHVGWIGVDLFFVLSGFLISGLLFNEYKSTGSLDFRRFFVRRGLKIYPSFYAFLLLSGLLSYTVFHTAASANRYLAEVFFVQNYRQGIWDHTWSLAVEEHFYIFLPILLLLLAKISRNRQEPFHGLPWVFVFVAASCIGFRAAYVFVGTPDYHMAYVASHARLDALLFGVVLSYLHQFRPWVIDEFIRSAWRRIVIGVCSAGLLTTAFLFQRDSRFFSTLGFSCVYLGFGGILLLSLHSHGILQGWIARATGAFGTALASVGAYSYSIYLWHGPVGAWFPGLVRRSLRITLGVNTRFVVYVIGSLAIGIAMSKIVEYPILRLRDKIFPTRDKGDR
jgi:peptidoglycan/LPS O-acetylase OafA/YrhL